MIPFKVNVSPTVTLSSSSPQSYTGYTNDGTQVDGTSFETITSLAPGGGTYGGTCGVYTGEASVSKSGNVITISIPQTIRSGNRFGLNNSHYDYSRNITVKLTLS